MANPFLPKTPTVMQQEKLKEFQDAFHDVYMRLEVLPKSRELALAMTNLEQAAMWASKAVVA